MPDKGCTGSADALARRFLQTAVVVDDRAHMPGSVGSSPQPGLVQPGRNNLPSGGEDQRPDPEEKTHDLDAGAITNAFSALGIICGVIGPNKSELATLRQADIVVLDWLLQDGESKYALELLHDLLDENSDHHALRLVAIYTGEAGLDGICKDVSAELKNAGLEPAENEAKTEIAYRHGLVVLYAKTGVNLPKGLKCRIVAETELPDRLAQDFAAMTEGLLPGIALTSLSAVREGEHKVLDRFSKRLDPAFLAHRTCLPNQDDAERQIVTLIAEELRGLMENSVVDKSPAGAQAVEKWIRRKGAEHAPFKFGDKTLTLDQTVELVTDGLKASNLREKDFQYLSEGFAGSNVANLDKELAWIMSFRTVYNAPPPILWLGSVITDSSGKSTSHLLCMRPRCDCVRLKDETRFLFLPIVEPDKKSTQIVVKRNGNFQRMGIELDSSRWEYRTFQPSGAPSPVIANKSDGHFEFKDAEGTQYHWLGELKAEYAQRIAQEVADSLSRVAVDESEWLRRISKGK